MHLWWLAAPTFSPWTLWSKKSGHLDVATRSSAEYWLSALEISMVAMVWCTLEKIHGLHASSLQKISTISHFAWTLSVFTATCLLSLETHPDTRGPENSWVYGSPNCIPIVQAICCILRHAVAAHPSFTGELKICPGMPGLNHLFRFHWNPLDVKSSFDQVPFTVSKSKVTHYHTFSFSPSNTSMPCLQR